MEFTEYLQMGNLEIYEALIYFEDILSTEDIEELADIITRIDRLKVKHGSETYYSDFLGENSENYDSDDEIFG